MRRALLVLLWLVGCGTLGSEELEDLPQPHGGVGPFRPLDRAETGVAGTPPGKALAVRQAVGAAMVTPEGWLFYAAAAPLDPGATQPEGLPPGDVAWALFEPRRIYRSDPGDDRLGFEPGEVVLEASAAWEGDAVWSPWAVTLEDGRSRLYYVGAGGIGVAEAPSVDGAFARVGEGPALAPGPGETLGRPSVVSFEGRWLAYFELGGGRLGVAESGDGLSFTRLGDLALPSLEEDPPGLAPEVGFAGPGAVVVETPAGRRLLRLYFESLREGGGHALFLAASLDGVAFERLGRPVVETPADAVDRRSPSAVPLDERVTVLYYTAPVALGALQGRALVAAVAPRSVRFVPAE